MLLKENQQFDRTNAFVGLFVLVSVFLIYNRTLAPTFSFWDCGEFVAAARSLGIPHPPGSPLYILVARLFSVLPISSDIAVRINLVSAVCNAGAALFGYLILVRLLRSWFAGTKYSTDLSTYSSFLIYAGSACGALIAAFGLTQWTNSVEAEVYGMTMLLMMASLWLTIIYYQNQETSLADKVMLLVVFIATIGIGVHLSAFLILPVAGILFVMRRKTPVTAWFAIAAFVFMELFLIFALSSKPGEIPLAIPLLIGLIIYAFYLFSFDRIPNENLLYALGLTIAALPAIQLLVKDGSVWIERLAWLGWVSWPALALTSLFALYRIFQYSSRSRTTTKDNNKLGFADWTPPLLVLLTLVMTAVLLFDLHGYGTFKILSLVLLVALGWFIRAYLRWTTMIALVAVGMVVIGVMPFFYGLIGAALLIPVIGLKLKAENWKTAMVILLVAASGYSIHSYLPIRSTQNPSIDQNSPSEGLDTTINFLERKQYGGQSMIERMFVRRAEWESQFGNFNRMGFWKFFSEQWGFPNQKFFLLFMIGIYGVWELVRRRPKLGLILLLLLLLSSIGLVLYMNFADGLRQEISGRGHIEVRDRDYFFTPFFVLFGLTIGLGVTLLIQYIRELTDKFEPLLKRVILVSLPVLMLLPGFALAGNYYLCDRSGNFMPYEYARNLLISCDPEAVLFTGGDNDTFPIWAMQEVYGFRTDVSVICLPLANTNWYIKQVRDNFGLELGWTNDQIDNLRPYRSGPDGPVVRIQEQLASAVIDNNFGLRPINYSITTGKGSQKYHGQPLDTLLLQKGMAMQLLSTPTKLDKDIERSYELYMNDDLFGFRSYNDPKVYNDPASSRSARNIAQSGIVIADSLLRAGDVVRAEAMARRLVDKLPQYKESVYFLATIMMGQEDIAGLKALVDTATNLDSDRLNVIYARGLRRVDQVSQAEIVLVHVLDNNPVYRPAFEEMTRLYVAANQISAIEGLFTRWVKQNPTDQHVKQMLRQMRQQRDSAEAQQRGPSGR